MMIGNILVCLDGSKLSESILPLVSEIAEHAKCRVVLLEVIVTPFRPRGLGRFEVVVKQPDQISESEKEIDSYLERVAGSLREQGLEVECITIEGSVADSIMAYARAYEIGLIAIASHGRRGLDRLFSGSVTESVLRSSGIPILATSPGKADTISSI